MLDLRLKMNRRNGRTFSEEKVKYQQVFSRFVEKHLRVLRDNGAHIGPRLRTRQRRSQTSKKIVLPHSFQTLCRERRNAIRLLALPTVKTFTITFL